jgi:1-acyl-sn-glycerol-3-phosphate acyltransferase
MSNPRSQVVGLPGKIVDGMMRRSVRKRFHNVWWSPPSQPVKEPCIFVPNHHGWFDGHLMYHAVTSLGKVTVDWIAEFDAFPLFRFCGGLPFPSNDSSRRAATIRTTVRRMQQEKINLLLFAEGVLHRPPEVLTFGKSLDLICRHVPEAHVIPVAIRYEHSMHERPEAYLLFGNPCPAQGLKSEEVRLKVKSLLDLSAKQISFNPDSFTLLAKGTPDVNERFDLRSTPWSRQKKP